MRAFTGGLLIRIPCLHCCGAGSNAGQGIKNLWATSIQFSRSVVSNSLQPHGLQHARPPCPSPTPGVYSNSCPLSQWCHPNISSSVVPFSSCLQSFQASGSFPMSQLFVSNGQSIGASASASVLWCLHNGCLFLGNKSPVTLWFIIRNPISDTEHLKPLEFPAMRVIKRSLAVLIRWLWDCTPGWGLFARRINHVIGGLELSVPPQPPTSGQNGGWRGEG